MSSWLMSCAATMAVKAAMMVSFWKSIVADRWKKMLGQVLKIECWIEQAC